LAHWPLGDHSGNLGGPPRLLSLPSGRTLALAEAFQAFLLALDGWQANGSLPEQVTLTPIYGPVDTPVYRLEEIPHLPEEENYGMAMQKYRISEEAAPDPTVVNRQGLPGAGTVPNLTGPGWGTGFSCLWCSGHIKIQAVRTLPVNLRRCTMLRRCRETLIGIFLALGMVILVLATTRAAGEGGPEWRTDTLSDFSQGTMDGVDVWSSPGTARLDHPWWSNVRVNDDPSLDKLYPRLSFVLTDTTQTHFLIVWADERDCDHCPDIYFARSTDGGKSWSPNVMVQDPCDPNDPPYPDCPCLTAPDITGGVAA